jgi:hypothetical protein
VQRLIEQPTGDGDVLEGRACLGRIHYHLSVYQHFSQIEDERLCRRLSMWKAASHHRMYLTWQHSISDERN